MGGHPPRGASAAAESRLGGVDLGVVCDTAYGVLVDQVVAQTLADRQGLIVAAALGAKIGDLPTVMGEVEELDKALNAPPVPVDGDTRMARYLGVG